MAAEYDMPYGALEDHISWAQENNEAYIQDQSWHTSKKKLSYLVFNFHQTEIEFHKMADNCEILISYQWYRIPNRDRE